jgi:hypothetical protein
MKRHITNEKAPRLAPEGFGNHTTNSADSTAGLTPRQQRALRELLRRRVSREQLDRITGASNSPQVVAQLRAMGLTIDCDRIEVRDRDGRHCRPGVYRIASASRHKAQALLKASDGKWAQ